MRKKILIILFAFVLIIVIGFLIYKFYQAPHLTSDGGKPCVQNSDCQSFCFLDMARTLTQNPTGYYVGQCYPYQQLKECGKIIEEPVDNFKKLEGLSISCQANLLSSEALDVIKDEPSVLDSFGVKK